MFTSVLVLQKKSYNKQKKILYFKTQNVFSQKKLPCRELNPDIISEKGLI